ncbi:MAG: phosphoribosyltransferase [Gaiella sp.]
MTTRRFRDRFHAGEVLAEALPPDVRTDVLVIGLARGGVQTAAAVARRLAAPLDVLAVRKVGHPWQPEYAIGAVAPGADGVYIRAGDGLSKKEVAELVHRAKQAAGELDEMFHERHPRLELSGRTVLLVDDGLATGATMIAAIRWAGGQGARRVIAAVPVGASASCALLRREAEVVCPNEMGDFGAVGFWYERFDQVGTEQVLALLDELDALQPARS